MSQWAAVALFSRALGLAAFAAGALAAGCVRADQRAEREERPAPPIPVRSVRVVAVHPHDPTAFTQGLVYHGGKLYESLGLEGRSALREVEIATGRVLREVRLPRTEFGEGLALAGEELVQLTWKNGIAHRWRLADFAPLGDLRYDGEGWGLAFDGVRFIESDGSARLTLRASPDFAATGTVNAVRDGSPAAFLNELELAGGVLYANVWQSDEIVRIDPASGRVEAAWSAAGLLNPEESAKADVLNGIAWNPDSKRFYLTGKLWPWLFEVELPEE